MSQSIEDLSAKFEDLEGGLTKKLEGIETLLQKMADKLDNNSNRLLRLEAAPPPPPQQPAPTRPATAPPHPPLRWVNPLDLNAAPQQEACPSAPSSERPSGHRNAHELRDVGGGILGSHPPHPGNGTLNGTPLYFEHQFGSHASTSKPSHMPKMDFPKFSGENPRLWADQCEMYFEIYSVSDALKTSFAALNFEGPAAAWLQTLELRGRIRSWSTLRKAVCDRFDKDQYQNHLRQLDNLCQTDSVTEYYEKFEQLSHNILLYNQSYDDTYFVTRFLSGLKAEIRIPIQLHRPQNVDTASALALLQEAEGEHSQKKEISKTEMNTSVRGYSRQALAHDKIKSKAEVKKPGEQSKL
ncbi:unnamed protein product [Urochloa humidicola]